MISKNDRRNPLKHLTDTYDDKYPAKTLKFLYEYFLKRWKEVVAKLLLKKIKI
jgi:hypothetical protein